MRIYITGNPDIFFKNKKSVRRVDLENYYNNNSYSRFGFGVIRFNLIIRDVYNHIFI